MRARRALLIASLQGLSACGFHPLLLGGGGGRPGTSARLHTVFVGNMPDRFGQVFRTALQTRLDGAGGAVTRQYELLAPTVVSVEQAGIQRDTSTTRVRVSVASSWSMVDLTPQRAIVASGFVRALDGWDIVNQQYLAAEFSADDAFRRVAANLADQITQQVATFFDGLSPA